MTYPEMNFSEKMDIVMETIWSLRLPTGEMKPLNHSKVKRHSANIAKERALIDKLNDTSALKGVSRNAWLKPDANKEWRAIRLAMDGELEPNHPVEIRIAEFADGGEARRFLVHIQKLDAECVTLRQKVKEAEGKYSDLERTVLQNQYLASYEMMHLKGLRQELRNKTKEIDVKDKIVDAAQLEADLLRIENDKLLKNAGATVVVENARSRLIEPKLSLLAHTPDNELLQAYQDSVREAKNDLLSLFSKSAPPKDVVFVFHGFNVDVKKFVNTAVPFRHAEGNVVFAGCLPNPETRRSLYAEIAVHMAPSNPRVVIVSGGMLRQTDVEREAKVVNINQRPGDIAINDRLRLALGSRFRGYDVVAEGYENVVHPQNLWVPFGSGRSPSV